MITRSTRRLMLCDWNFFQGQLLRSGTRVGSPSWGPEHALRADAATRTVLTAPAWNKAAIPSSESTIPTTNLRFSPAPASVPTRGRALDHIGFEVRDLAAFCTQLEAKRVKLSVRIAYRTASGPRT